LVDYLRFIDCSYYFIHRLGYCYWYCCYDSEFIAHLGYFLAIKCSKTTLMVTTVNLIAAKIIAETSLFMCFWAQWSSWAFHIPIESICLAITCSKGNLYQQYQLNPILRITTPWRARLFSSLLHHTQFHLLLHDLDADHYVFHLLVLFLL